MHGIVSLLDSECTAKVEAIWQELEQDCGLTGNNISPFPHFSWQIAEKYDLEKLEPLLIQLAAEVKPFSVQTCGVALFTSNSPVLYIPIVRSRMLSDIHKYFWDCVIPISSSPSELYAPSSWMPHISLAHKDIESENLNCLMDKLGFRIFNWEIHIDNLSLIYETEGGIGVHKYRCTFSG